MRSKYTSVGYNCQAPSKPLRPLVQPPNKAEFFSLENTCIIINKSFYTFGPAWVRFLWWAQCLKEHEDNKKIAYLYNFSRKRHAARAGIGESGKNGVGKMGTSTGFDLVLSNKSFIDHFGT